MQDSGRWTPGIFSSANIQSTGSRCESRPNLRGRRGFGWDEAIAKHRAKEGRDPKIATVGDLLSEVGATAGFRRSTFTTYAQSLRRVVSEIAGIGDQPVLDDQGVPVRDPEGAVVLYSRYDYRAGGGDAWREKVDAQRLDILTPAAIQRWRLAYVARAGDEPDAVCRAKNGCSSWIRNARALFSGKALHYVRDRLVLPDPLPFSGVKLEKGGTSRYISRIDAGKLITEAKAELDGEPFLIFCLALFCGLRKREIDSLLWSQVDFESGQIRIEPTKYFQPKSEESIGAVDLDPELLALLKGWKPKTTGEFVLPSTRSPRYEASRTNYRCERHFGQVYDWLRSKGVTARKPLHELRKELGAILASQSGLFAAQRVLRHAQYQRRCVLRRQETTDHCGFGQLVE